MSTDPELADAPDTPQDIAWEIRHCADRLNSLAELVFEMPHQERACLMLYAAAERAHFAALRITGESP